MDTVSKVTRSRMMAGIRSKNTEPELRVRSVLHRSGFRFKIHDRRLPGKPDVVLPRLKTVFLIHGCFWHHHRCLRGRLPGQNRSYWAQKILRNRERDAHNRRLLRKLGWAVAVVWECEVRKSSDADLSRRLSNFLADKPVRVHFAKLVHD